MTTTDRAALLERAADALRESAERADADGQVGTADKDFAASLARAAWAAELRAEPPWLDAPDGPGDDWVGGEEGTEAIDLSVERLEDVLFIREPTRPWTECALVDWIADCPGWRYRRRTPVVVPPREVTP